MKFARFEERALTAVALVLLAATASADTTYINVNLVPSGTLTGTVLASGLGNHSGNFVYVGGTSIVGVTNSAGSFTMVGVPYGTYSLTATRAGYIDKNVTGVTISTAGQTVSLATLTLNPSSETEAGLFGAAMRLYTYDKFNEAIVAFRALRNSNPSGPYAAASLYRVALSFGSMDLYDSAIAVLTSFTSSYPADSLIADAYYSRGGYKDAQLNYAAALLDFQYVVAHYPAYPIASRAQYRIGSTYESLKNSSAAISAYQALVTNYPSSPDVPKALFGIAWEYYSTDMFSQGLTAFQQVITSFPTSIYAARASHYKGMCYYYQDNFNSAITAFNTAITNYPSGDKLVDSWYYRTHCKYYSETYTYIQAKTDYQYIVTNFAGSESAVSAKYYLGNCEYNLSNYSSAIALYEALIAAHPTSSWVSSAHDKIAQAYYSGGEYNNALTAYVFYYTTYASSKNGGDAHYWAGRCWERLNGSVSNLDAHAEYCTVLTSFPNCEKSDEALVRRDIVGAPSCL